MTASWLSRAVSTFALSFPVVVWTSDSICSVYKVRGKSMEPSLKDGDVVLVRKADIVRFLVKDISNIFTAYDFGTRELTSEERILQIEGRPARILSRPPLVVPGDVVVFCNPNTAFPNQNIIKRIVATGGQMVRPGNRFQTFETVPPFNLWVEGENEEVSEDSNTYGPVSKKLLVGQAECILWPPSRWGRIQKVEPPKGRAWWTR